MPMYNLIEYSKNYRKTTGSLWNCYRDEPNSGFGGDDNNINYSIKNSKSFNYKTSITGKLGDNNRTKENVETAVPLSWSENCALTSKATRDADPDSDPAVNEINAPTGATFKIKDTKLYVPAVTL